MYIKLPEAMMNGKITAEDISGMYNEMEKNMILSNITFPDKPSSDGYYHVWIPDKSAKSGRRQIKSKDLKKLKENAYKRIKQNEDPQQEKHTFKEVFKLAQDSKLEYIKDPEKKLSVINTINVNKSCYKRFFSGTEFEEMEMCTIVKDDIESFCYNILQNYDLKATAFRLLCHNMRTTFRYAYENYWIPENVYDRVNFQKFKSMTSKPVPLTERVHSDKEVDLILEAIHEKQQKKPCYMPAYALELQIIIGARRGEIPPLKWEDITNDYLFIHREQITVKKTEIEKKQNVIVNHTKTYKNRKFPITTELDLFITKLKAVHKEYHLNSEYLFPYDNKNGVISNEITYEYYYRTCKKLGIKLCREFIKGTHSFRRNAITKAVNNSNGNIFLASQLYGNSPKIAEKNYYTGLNISQAKTILEGELTG